MPEIPLEQVIEEQRFAAPLQAEAVGFFGLSTTLLGLSEKDWTKKHYYQLIHEANELESFLDDYGARYNRSWSFFTELVASLRGLAQVAYSIAHLAGRFESYGVSLLLPSDVYQDVLESVGLTGSFVRRSISRMLKAAIAEANARGVEVDRDSFPEEQFRPVVAQDRLPRNVGEEEISDERQKIAEVASKYLLACDMLECVGGERVEDPVALRKLVSQVCTEEQARVYEATVHNLQSAYDTYIRNTVIESRDEHLPSLRGYASVALHLLQAVTGLTHFYERHENDIRSEAAKTRIAELIDRNEVLDMLANHALQQARRVMESGRSLAEGLVDEYTNLQQLEVQLSDDLVLHARPAALIVGIANHYGTPVELEVAGQRCNAASILELLVTVGSHPDEKKFVFRGDENPLRDIGLLFQYGLGERGMENLPEQLSYLRAN